MVTASLLYHKHISLVKYFFHLFETFFALVSAFRVRDLVILPHLSRFVKSFLKKSLKFLNNFSDCKATVKSNNLSG